MFKNLKCEDFIGRRHFLMLASMTGGMASLLSVAGIASALEAHNQPAVVHVAAEQQTRSLKTSQTAAALRDLWVGHIFWVRSVSLAAINKNDAAMKAAEGEAVANARSIAASIEPFYGTAAKDTFFKLLAGHYGAIKAYLVATVGDNTSAQAPATQSLTSNAEEITAFLSKANPHLPKQALHTLLLAHGGHHIQQIQQLRDRNYASEAKTWEHMKTHVYQIADATADALAKQFPKKF